MKNLFLLTLTFLFLNPILKAQHFALNLTQIHNLVTVDSLTGDGIRTIEFWFNPAIDYNAETPEPATFVCRDTPNQNEEFGIYIGPASWAGQEGRIVFFRRIGSDLFHIVSNRNQWNAGKWVHVAGVIHPLDGMQLYIDGALQDDTDASTMPTMNSTYQMTFGTWTEYGLRPFFGQLDELRLWHSPRSAAEIFDGMVRPMNPAVDQGLLCYYNFNEGSGDIATDMSGNQHDLKVATASYQPTGTGLYFNGETSSVDLGADLGNNLRAIELWFKLKEPIDASLSQPQTLIYRNATPNQGEFGLYFGESTWAGKEGRLVFAVQIQDEFNFVVSDDNEWEAGKWHHVLAQIDPTEGMRLYVDYVLQNDQTLATEATETRAESLSIGKWGDFDIRYFKGVMDDVRLWEKAVSIEEVQDFQCDVLTVENNTGLKAWFGFDENSGSLAQNLLSRQTYQIDSDTSWLEIRKCNTTLINNTTPTGTKELAQNKQQGFQVFPNPLVDRATVHLVESSNATWYLSLYDAQGQVVITQRGAGPDFQLERKNLSAGMYFLKVATNTGSVYTEKVIVE